MDSVYSGFLLLCIRVLYSTIPGHVYRIAHMYNMATPYPVPLHLDAVVAMRSESRAAPRAIATVIFSF